MLRWLLLSIALVAGCPSKSTSHSLDLDLIRVSPEARLRTDIVGDGKWEKTQAFVLVDAENTSNESCYITLAGDLTDDAGTVVGTLKPQSLWTPAHESRTFALIDSDRQPRPGATSARIKVRGAVVDLPPPAHVEDIHVFFEADKTVVQGTVVNHADRWGKVIVIGSFHDAAGKPTKRPFDVIDLGPKASQNISFVGPAAMKRATLFVGDSVY
jgi:hypothetical protein